ncbi:MAG: hypothetical protein V3U54_08690 [Thermodesulfobacteriota bacterium]
MTSRNTYKWIPCKKHQSELKEGELTEVNDLLGDAKHAMDEVKITFKEMETQYEKGEITSSQWHEFLDYTIDKQKKLKKQLENE